MSYNPAIPAANELISVSQGQIQTNFSQANGIFGNDHYAFNAPSNAGSHKQVTLVAEAAPSTPVSQVAVYCNTVSAVTDLFMRRESDGASLQLTGNIMTASGNDGHGGTYQLFQTPWGLKFFTGTTAAFSGNRNFTLSASVFGGTVYTSQATGYDNGTPTGVYMFLTGGTNAFQLTTAFSIIVKWFVITN